MNGGAAPLSASAAAAATPPHRRLLDFLQSVNLKYFKLGYHYLITHLLTLMLLPLMAVILLEAGRTDPDDLRQLWLHLRYNLVSVLVLFAVLMFGATVYMLTRPRPVYLVDFACYKPPGHLQVRFEEFMRHSKLCGFSEDVLEFQRKILERSGLSEETYVPEAMHAIPPQPTMANAGPRRGPRPRTRSAGCSISEAVNLGAPRVTRAEKRVDPEPLDFFYGAEVQQKVHS